MSSRIRLGLERITSLLERLENPQRSYEIIHVAGTNGKGSVSAMLANTLTRAGIKTGLYTSPHLAYRWDCIRIDNECLKHSQFAQIEKSVKKESRLLEAAMQGKTSADFGVSTFEQMTATALKAFQRNQVEVAIVEVGLGGEHDATNVVQPILSVITAIGIDHTDFLGKTIGSIAQAKGGIIKSGVPVVVTSDQEYGEVFGVLGQIQRRINPDQKIQWTPPNSTLDFRISNRNTARAALQYLRDSSTSRMRAKLASMSDEAIEQGLTSTLWPGRCESINLEILDGPKRALIDGAHNKQSIAALRAVLDAEGAQLRVFICAMTNGKDATHLANLLRPGDVFLAVTFEKVDDMQWIVPMPSNTLCSTILEMHKEVKGIDFGSDLSSAIRHANSLAETHQLVLCGSLYLVGQLYRQLDAARHEQLYFSDKSMTDTPLGSYDPLTIENKIQQYWQDYPPSNPAARLRPERQMKFLLPPPNVTGSLHIGHALTLSVEDAYCRYYRALGHRVSWVPGTDHAGIATQSVVSKQLAKEGINTQDLSREDFVEHIWKWKEKFGSIIASQMRRLGTSLDWNAGYFTLDETRRAAVLEAFRKLWEAGLIHREQRMVNWSTGLQSVVSDIEVDDHAIEGPTTIEGVEFGKMWRIKYEVVSNVSSDSPRHVNVDTTRPETVFGDRALAVHPEDERYRNLIGSYVKHPLLDDINLEIVADRNVKREFGTGCVKLTPAHDVSDYEICQRHPGIPLIPVYGRDGKMLPISKFPSFAGLDRLQARDKVLALLQARGALVSWTSHKTTIAMCSRSQTLIEPLLMPQWYISMRPLADLVRAKDDIEMGDSVRRDWNRWLENTQDWCISRQLVWGHRIPLWRVDDIGSREERWVYGRDRVEALQHSGGQAVRQDDDVLDTWFSSSLLPLSAFGWPFELEPDHQLDFIESGPDILFFWLIRMAVMCNFMIGRSPFQEIVLHPLIRDSQGRKMSKSLGNVIDPMSLIQGQSLQALTEGLAHGNLKANELQRATKELQKTYPEGIRPFGADALRFALIQSTMQTEALRFDVRSIENARYLCTKIWNAVNFYNFNLARTEDLQIDTHLPPVSTKLMSTWMFSQSRLTQIQYDAAFESRTLSQATASLRYLIVDRICDVYLEFMKVDLQMSKSRKESMKSLADLKTILEHVLQMLAPFMPHIAEELWHVLGNTGSIHREFHKPLPDQPTNERCEDIEARVAMMLALLRMLRSLPNRQQSTGVIHIDESGTARSDLQAYLPHIKQLSGLAQLTLTAEPPASPATYVDMGISFTVVTKETHSDEIMTASTRMKLEKKLEKLREATAKPDYHMKVPEAIKTKHKSEMQKLENRLGI